MLPSLIGTQAVSCRRAEMSPDGWCEACDRAEHIACAGVGKCECDLCVPYDLRGEAIAAARRRLNSAQLCGNE